MSIQANVPALAMEEVNTVNFLGYDFLVSGTIWLTCMIYSPWTDCARCCFRCCYAGSGGSLCR